jgi:hypothetical protein
MEQQSAELKVGTQAAQAEIAIESDVQKMENAERKAAQQLKAQKKETRE